MGEWAADEVLGKIEEARALYQRLVLVVGPAGSGKTAALQRVSAATSAPLINVNLELSRRMLDRTERQRVLQLHRLADEMIAEALGGRPASAPAALVLLDNTEILFAVHLKQDPLRLLQGLARRTTVVASWNGCIADRHLTYAVPDHPEYRRYPVGDLILVAAASQERGGSSGGHAWSKWNALEDKDARARTGL